MYKTLATMFSISLTAKEIDGNLDRTIRKIDFFSLIRIHYEALWLIQN